MTGSSVNRAVIVVSDIQVSSLRPRPFSSNQADGLFLPLLANRQPLERRITSSELIQVARVRPGAVYSSIDLAPGAKVYLLKESGRADGTPDTTTFELNNSALSVTFFDKSDVAAAPDTGSTLGLLVLTLTALLGTSRLRSFQLA